MMARPLRIEYPGAFYHVINRGNAGEEIFKNIRDREKFMTNLETATERFDLRIHTYCLMTNHYHLLVETPRANLSQAVKWINVSYAAYYNRKHQRRGHLFQGRFKAILVDADAYLKHLSRYIHLNPLRAKMVEDLAVYRWSSYPAFIGKLASPAWLKTEWLLSMFGNQPKVAMRNYQRFVETKEWASIDNPSKDVIGGLLLGSADFVNWVKTTCIDRSTLNGEISQAVELKSQPSPDDIVARICEEFSCMKNDVVQRGRKKNTARDVAIYLARDLSGVSNVQLGTYFGQISGAGITVRYNHLMQQLNTDRRLRTRVDQIRKLIINN
jgi:putative transposase